MDSIARPFFDLKKAAIGGEKIAFLTCYDATMARQMRLSGVDAVLVGDSLAQVIQGRPSTVFATLEHMIYHTQAVKRGADKLAIMTDLPDGSYKKSPQQALESSKQLFDAGAQMVKLEGEAEIAPTVELLASSGFMVCAHLGLMPQSADGQMGVVGKSPAARKRIINAAKTLYDAGADWLLLEWSTRTLAAQLISACPGLPVIGIGCGPDCHAQILVEQDVLGLSQKPPPFAKQTLGAENPTIGQALTAWVESVKNKTFPEAKHWRE